jgi:hypothetical protein
MQMNEFIRQDPPDYYVYRASSPGETASLASFPVKFPTAIPSEFVLSSVRHLWPPHLTQERRAQKPHADYVVADYIGPGGTILQVIQGFTGRFIAWATRNPPEGKGDAVSINGHKAFWITAVPVGHRSPSWEDGRFSYVGWQDGVHPAPDGGVGDSPRYYGLVSDRLSVNELIEIAGTVPATPFVTTP